VLDPGEGAFCTAKCYVGKEYSCVSHMLLSSSREIIQFKV
jgi:hypothetical protein